MDLKVTFVMVKGTKTFACW